MVRASSRRKIGDQGCSNAAIGRRLFGEVPTPQKLMAHRPALMLGLGALWTSIERFGTLDGRLRALMQLHVARLYDVAY